MVIVNPIGGRGVSTDDVDLFEPPCDCYLCRMIKASPLTHGTHRRQMVARLARRVLSARRHFTSRPAEGPRAQPR